MALPNQLEAFIWGAGGSKKTPAEIAKEKEIAQALLMRAGNTSPVDHWTQGAARVADALSGVIKERRAEKAGVENSAYNQELIGSLLGGAAPQAGIPGANGMGAELAATSPGASAAPLDMSGNEVFSGFMDTVKQGVQNPYALAAIAATGKAESGFDPKNATRTWSDPSESGQPGTAGGIMSWRGPRYQALAATGDLSPQGQANFFLSENPKLITALNSAKSVEEAQSLMNNAWQFAGYNRPGGEAANRLAAAQSFLPAFQGGTQVASAGPQAAIEAAAPGSGYVDPMVSAPNAMAPAEAMPGQITQNEFDQRWSNSPASPMVPPMPAPIDVATPPSPPQGMMQEPAPQMAPQAPQQMAQAGPDAQAIIRAMSDPRATPETRAIAQALLQQQMAQQQAQQEMRIRQSDPAYQIGLEKSRLELESMRNPRQEPTAEMRNLEWRAQQAGLQPGTPEFNSFMATGGKPSQSTNVTVNTGEGSKFYEALDKKNAETFSALSEEGMRGRGKLAQIDRLEQLMATAPQGSVGALKLAAGEYGINTEGLNDIQAAQALINELVPQQRQPGSGPMSDADLALFKQSLPRIISQPGANQMILQTMRGITQYQIQMGEIADAVANRELTPEEARKNIRALENPLDGYTKAVRQMENDQQDDGWKELTPGVRVRRLD